MTGESFSKNVCSLFEYLISFGIQYSKNRARTKSRWTSRWRELLNCSDAALGTDPGPLVLPVAPVPAILPDDIRGEGREHFSGLGWGLVREVEADDELSVLHLRIEELMAPVSGRPEEPFSEGVDRNFFTPIGLPADAAIVYRDTVVRMALARLPDGDADIVPERLHRIGEDILDEI